VGSDDALSAVILARPDLRSAVARFPWVAFGLAPVLILTLVVAAALLLEGGLIFLSPPVPPWAIPWTRFSLDALNWLTTYAAPLVIAALLCVIAIRQRMAAHWIVLGISITCIAGGFHEIGVSWSSVQSEPSELQLSFALAPPYPAHLLIAGALRAAINLAIVGAAYGLWLRTATA
jgi:hypothetical protein